MLIWKRYQMPVGAGIFMAPIKSNDRCLNVSMIGGEPWLQVLVAEGIEPAGFRVFLTLKENQPAEDIKSGLVLFVGTYQRAEDVTAKGKTTGGFVSYGVFEVLGRIAQDLLAQQKLPSSVPALVP